MAKTKKYMLLLAIVSITVVILNSCCNCGSAQKHGGKLSVDSVITESMALYPSVEVLSDSAVSFKLRMVRLKPLENEYLPTSEDYRVEVFSEKTTLIWSSNYSSNFLQVVSDVEPLKTGESKTHEIIWKCVNNSGKKVPPDNYIVKMTVPAKPNPYKATIKFRLESKNDR